MNKNEISGCRVLVVEDEMMVAMLLEDMLEQLGCKIVATAARPSAAIDAIEENELDAAILDLNLGGESSHDVAETLMARGLPFMFSTGYGSSDVPEAYRDRPVLHKPFRLEDLTEALRSILRQDGSGSGT